MKKIIAIILSMTMSAALCACSEKHPEISEKKVTAVSKEAEPAVAAAVKETAAPKLSDNDKKTMSDTVMLSVSSAIREDNKKSDKEKADKEKAAEPKIEKAPAKETAEQAPETVDYFGGMSTEEMAETLYEAMEKKMPSADKNIYEDMQYVLDKYGIDTSTLVELSGLSEDSFYYNWNNYDNQELKAVARDQLFGKNYFDSADKTHLVSNNLVTLKALQAYWDNDGALHVLCSIKSGFKGITYNISIDDLDVYSNGNLIASKSFGYITRYVDRSNPEKEIEAIPYDYDFKYEFVFEGDSVTEPYANIMNDLGITYKTYSEYYNVG